MKLSTHLHKLRNLTFVLIFLSSCALGQTFNLTAVVQDANQIWKNGTFSVEFVPTPNTPGPFTFNGSTALLHTYTGTMNVNGFLTVALPPNTVIKPAGSKWHVTVCSQAASGCGDVYVTMPGNDTDISGQLTAAIPPVAVSSVSLTAPAYQDTNIVVTPRIGNTYYDVTNLTPKWWNGVAWINPPILAGNNNFSGTNVLTGITTLNGVTSCKNFSGVRCIDAANSQGWAGSDPGAWINAALADIPSTGGEIQLAGCGTITTQVLINNRNYIKIRANGSNAAVICNNGIVGNPSEPAFKITGTSSYITIQGFAIVGNGITGNGGNGHAISIIGTGATPAEIFIDNMYLSFHKGNGKDGTGATLLAAGVYSYQAIGVFVRNGSSLQGNWYGTYADANSNNFHVSDSVINGNFINGSKAVGLATFIYTGNDAENNGSGASQQGAVLIDGVNTAKVELNHFEANTQDFVVANAIGMSAGAVFQSNYSRHTIDNRAAAELTAGAIGATIGHNTCQLSVTILGVCYRVNDGVVNPRIINNTIYATAGSTLLYGILFDAGTFGVTGGLIDGNDFGRSQANIDGTITNGIFISGPGSSHSMINNSFYAANGATITNGITLQAGSLNAVLLLNTFQTAGTGAITNQIVDAGTNTTKIGTTGAITATSAAMVGALTAGANKFVVSSGGVPTSISNITTAGLGTSPIVANISLTAQSAAIAATTMYTPGADGFYRACGQLVIDTAGGAGTISPQMVFNSTAGAAVGRNMGQDVTVTSQNLDNITTSTMSANCISFKAKSGTAIQYRSVFNTVTVGSLAYSYNITLERLN